MVAAEKTVVTITIAGDDYTIRAEATPEYTKECARYVDATISQITRQSRTVMEPHKAAILAALSLADQLFQARRELEAERAQMVAHTDRIIARIEGKLTPSDLAANP